MSKEKIVWEWVAGFFVLVVYGIWTFFVWKNKIPVFDFETRRSFFHYDTFVGLMGQSFFSLLITVAMIVVVLGVISIIFFSSRETYRAGRMGISKAQTKIKEKMKNVKKNKTEETKEKSKPGMGESTSNL